jgi:heme A synthase
VAQIGVGASMVLGLLPPTLRAAHLLVGTLVWATLVVLMFHSARTPVEEPDADWAAGPPPPSVLGDLVPSPSPASSRS